MKHSVIVYYYRLSLSLSGFMVIVTSQQHCFPPDAHYEGEYLPCQNKFLVGSEVTYTCNDGSILLGKSKRTCNPNGTWSDEPPFCDYPTQIEKPPPATAMARVVDNNSTTCYLWEKSPRRPLRLNLSKQVIVQAVRILFERGTVKFQVSTGVNERKCAEYDSFIDKKQWVLIRCTQGARLADTIRFRSFVDRSENVSICEIEVYGREENDCERPPGMRIDNGYLKFDRKKATLICEDGYKNRNDRISCTGKKWKSNNPKCDGNLCEPLDRNSTPKGEWKAFDNSNRITAGTRMQLKCHTGYRVSGDPETVICMENGAWTRTTVTCVENLCDPLVYNSSLTSEGEWIFLDAAKNAPDVTLMQLICDTGYKVEGSPDTATCLENGTWSKTNAICIEDEKKQDYIIIASVGAVFSILMLILFGVCWVKKKRNAEVSAVNKATGNNSEPDPENIYDTIDYDTLKEQYLHVYYDPKHYENIQH